MTKCACGRKGKFRELNREYIDVLFLTIEEDIAEIDNDASPQKIKVILKQDLTDSERIADLVPPSTVRIIGTVKEMPIIRRKGGKSTNVDIIIEANNYELIEDSLKRIKFTNKDIEQFKELSKHPDLLEKLSVSVAPHLAGHEKIKEALLLFIVKGVKKESSDKSIKSRDFFHILLVGDPGSGKSEFGKEVHNISVKSKMAVGKGASGVGLTGSAEKDELLGERVLTAGTIPLCNGGHVVIDEVDKMEEEVQSHLLDCMESGKIDITKSRVEGRLKANVGVFMIANPKTGVFDEYNPLAPQINLTPPLVSRFDLIFPIMDHSDEKKDKELFKKIISKHKDIECLSKRCIEFDLLRKYLFYVSQEINPKISERAEVKMEEYFAKMRNNSANGNKHTIGITGRQLEGVVRLSEAYAKLRMGKNVSAMDVQNAIDITQIYLEKLAFDQETGNFDINKVTTGMSTSERNSYNKIKMIIAELEKDNPNRIPVEDIVIKASEEKISEEQVVKAIKKLKKDGDIFEPNPGFVKRL